MPRWIGVCSLEQKSIPIGASSELRPGPEGLVAWHWSSELHPGPEGLVAWHWSSTSGGGFSGKLPAHNGREPSLGQQ